MGLLTKISKRKMAVKWLLLLVLVVGAEWLKSNPEIIETYYATGFYPIISKGLRFLIGWLPFSLGDLLVAVLMLWLLFRLFRYLRNRKTGERHFSFGKAIEKFISGLVIVYLLFLVLWGFSYYRLGSAYQLNIQPVTYSNADLDSLLNHLQIRLEKLSADSISVEESKTRHRSNLSKEAVAGFKKAATFYPFLSFRLPSLKPMLLGNLQSYTGYSGYVFPFTGEAQVNFHAPDYDLPFTVCHEMAHQLGYGSESEANMVGYLACRQSDNPAFRYSGYSNMQGYALLEMRNRDSSVFLQYKNKVPAILQKDRLESLRFNESHESFLQPVLNWVYARYLYSNDQGLGLDSYSYVVAWLIAYGKKYGWESI